MASLQTFFIDTYLEPSFPSRPCLPQQKDYQGTRNNWLSSRSQCKSNQQSVDRRNTAGTARKGGRHVFSRALTIPSSCYCLVKLVRCLGLNYADHAVRKIFHHHCPDSNTEPLAHCLGGSQASQTSVSTIIIS